MSLKRYPFIITGKCLSNGKALQGVLVPGMSFDGAGQKTELYQAYTKRNGRFTPGVFSDSLTTLIAQKKGYTSNPATGFEHINVSEKSGSSDYNFDFVRDAALMTVPVVFISIITDPPKMYL